LMLSRTKETIKEMERGSKIGPLRKKQAEAWLSIHSSESRVAYGDMPLPFFRSLA
jgi:hypothetical protein